MGALGLLLAAVVPAACSSPPVTVDLPPKVHRGKLASTGSGRIGVRQYANSGHCWFLRDASPVRAHHPSHRGHPRPASGSPAPQPRPSGPATGAPSPPAPSVAVPTSVTTCRSDAHRYAS